jgi:hypothetical protein
VDKEIFDAIWDRVAMTRNYICRGLYIRDGTGIHTLEGVTNDTIGDGLAINISGGDGADNQGWPSEIAPYDEDGTCVFNYTDDGCGAIRADTGTYKMVYFAFGFEAINSAEDRNVVMERVMRWLSLP